MPRIRNLIVVITVMVLGILLCAAPVTAQSSATYVVQPGDTLFSISRRQGVNVQALAAANGLTLNSWVYVGQRLTIPGSTGTPASPPVTGDTYTVQRGDTLFSIARRHGTTVAALKSANGLTRDTIYVGQRLRVSGSATVPVPAPSQPAPGHGTAGEKWIDINLSTQTLTAYEGRTPVFTAIVSTGTSRTPTVVGTYSIYVKYRATTMSGPGYHLTNVPFTMYFYRGYGIHGTYWHNNFGTPMSHGCVNMRTPDAEWLYNWAPVGTKVVTHY